MTLPSAISVKTKYLPSSEQSLPALALQVTRLVNSYMLWIGTTDVSPEDISKAPLQGSLARDWACAMAPSTVCVIVTITDVKIKTGWLVGIARTSDIAVSFVKF